MNVVTGTQGQIPRWACQRREPAFVARALRRGTQCGEGPPWKAGVAGKSRKMAASSPEPAARGQNTPRERVGGACGVRERVGSELD